MVLTITFFVSGAVIALMLVTKRVEMSHKRTFILLRAISMGDERVRGLAHRSAHRYSESKERAAFFITKQLPLRTRKFLNKTSSQLEELGTLYLDRIRGSKVLRSTDEGLSDFFKNLSSKESSEKESDSKKEDSQTGEDIVR